MGGKRVGGEVTQTVLGFPSSFEDSLCTSPTTEGDRGSWFNGMRAITESSAEGLFVLIVSPKEHSYRMFIVMQKCSSVKLNNVE